ncbi:hypothetical protein MLAC_34970 [Mycobacterium lacus]|uniref:Mycofactocin n=1 Tax=Mycobacterium lacus TaxID=169765 RepID=A0A7I7NPL5_9MYCO|nr:hypothetical protein MLAC_34970 [Mycobacterium lacus]
MVSSSGAGPAATRGASDPPFRFGTRCHILATIVTGATRCCRVLSERQMQMDHETDTDTELVTETLVDEVSIDGMCGVY